MSENDFSLSKSEKSEMLWRVAARQVVSLLAGQGIGSDAICLLNQHIDQTDQLSQRIANERCRKAEERARDAEERMRRAEAYAQSLEAKVRDGMDVDATREGLTDRQRSVLRDVRSVLRMVDRVVEAAESRQASLRPLAFALVEEVVHLYAGVVYIDDEWEGSPQRRE